MANENTSDVRIVVKNLWKIFGPQPNEIINEPWVHKATKSEILEKSKHVVAVRDVSFDVQVGEVFVIMGLSGSGKSTLLRCLNCLITPTKGEVIIDDKSIYLVSNKELRELRCYKMSMVFQHFGLLPHRKVIDNVTYGLEIRGQDKEARNRAGQEVIKMVGLEGWENHYPRELSGGMQQRVGLARALAVNPEILLFDEPFSALDPLIRNEMQVELINLQEQVKKTIIFITHDFLEAIKIGDKIAIMMDGVFVQVGSPEEIVSNPATEYVKKFVRDVPRVKVLSAQYLKTEPKLILSLDQSVETSLNSMSALEIESAMVINTEGIFQGIVHRQDLEISATKGDQNLKKSIISQKSVANPETLLEELISLVSLSKTPVPVLDDKGKVLGEVNPQKIISAVREE